MAWYYAASMDADCWPSASSREEAIEQGAFLVEPGQKFCIGEGDGHAPWSKLFTDVNDLMEYVDEGHEDRAFEEGFTDEAGLSKADFEPLLEKINQAWSEFIALHQPRSRLIDFSSQEEITRPAEEPARA